MVKRNSLSVLFLLHLLILHDSIHTAPVSPNNDLINSKCQRAFTYEEILEILEHNSCPSPIELGNQNSILHRQRRAGGTSDDQTVASTNNMYALQNTIIDHRTMIDDHRKMIYYLMNNTVNITQLDQHYSEQHSRSAPIWKSWRDISLILLLTIGFSLIIGFALKRLHFLDRLTTFLLRRQHQHRQQQQQQQQKKPQSGVPTSKAAKPTPIANVTREYLHRQYDSNESL